jgi:tryptophan synthase alpha subunit
MSSILGITGTRSASVTPRSARAVERLKRPHQLPVAVGFGIKTPSRRRRSPRRRCRRGRFGAGSTGIAD